MPRFLRHFRPLDWLFPPICAVCETGLENGRALCEPCITRLPRIKSPFCEICGESFEGQVDGSFDCPNCDSVSFHFESARASLKRSEDTLNLVHRLKYLKHVYLADELGRLSAEVFEDRRYKIAVEEGWPLVPVPLHRSRKRKRQFNQAALIADKISDHTELEVADILRRNKRTTTQTRLSRHQRLENLKGAFSMKKSWRSGKVNLPGAVLVDDVFTTGSTVNECAKVLRKAGFKRVLVVTVLRG